MGTVTAFIVLSHSSFCNVKFLTINQNATNMPLGTLHLLYKTCFTQVLIYYSEPVSFAYESLSDREPTPNTYSSIQNIGTVTFLHINLHIFRITEIFTFSERARHIE